MAVSSDAYFSSDRVAVRATMRVGFGFPASARLAVIALDGEPIAA
ncbi:phage major capsid protein [Micrococcus aloeverae]|nr:phage major capsid protein [Micrococcus aloeverae]